MRSPAHTGRAGMKGSLGGASRRGWRAAGAVVVLAALAACGGGGGGGSGADPSAGGLSSTPQGASASAGSAPLAAQLQPGDFTLNGTTAGDQGRAAAVAL